MEKKVEVIYCSPPWGGPGYENVEIYTLDFLYPNFNDLIKKCVEFSSNIILFLPLARTRI